jgi:hypothetical protein
MAGRGPDCATIEQVRPGRRDQQDRHHGVRLHREIDQFQKAVARPVKVFDGKD